MIGHMYSNTKNGGTSVNHNPMAGHFSLKKRAISKGDEPKCISQNCR
jgi:hypothetical protein